MRCFLLSVMGLSFNVGVVGKVEMVAAWRPRECPPMTTLCQKRGMAGTVVHRKVSHGHVTCDVMSELDKSVIVKQHQIRDYCLILETNMYRNARLT
jgi:hypothetical protein